VCFSRAQNHGELLKKQHNELQTFVNKSLFNIIEIKCIDRVTLTELINRADQTTIKTNIIKRTWTWIGQYTENTQNIPQNGILNAKEARPR